MRQKIIGEILRERERQESKAGFDSKFDANNSRNDWVAYITAYTGRAADKCMRNNIQGEDFRANMVKVAALALAAIEAYDKNWC